MTYIAFAIFCLFFLASWRRASKLQKHDRVLFSFCQLRREIISFLHEETSSIGTGAHITCNDYHAVRKLVDNLNFAIHEYKDRKTLMFNVRTVLRYLDQYKQTKQDMDWLHEISNVQVKGFYYKFVRCLAIAYLAYTPLIRFELVLRMFVHAYCLAKAEIRGAWNKQGFSIAKEVHSDSNFVYG